MELKPEWRALLTAAQKAAPRAYAPYSHLHVGAALEGENGRIYPGCNVENASYGLTICAERATVFTAVADGMRSFTRLLIYTPDTESLAPCVACRQVLREFAQELEILSVGKDGATRTFRLSELLPEAFGLPVESKSEE